MKKGALRCGSETIQYDLLFAVRKTLEIAVYPDSKVVVKAPLGCNSEEIQAKVAKRSSWIRKQLMYFKQFEPKTPPRRFVGGETHMYLGRQFRLKIMIGTNENVKLTRGYFFVTIQENESSDKVRKLMEEWYYTKAAKQFEESLERCWERFKHISSSRPSLRLRRMKKRWGSLSRNGTLTLNPNLILVPKECIDYVVTHELCHLLHYGHTPSFYHLLDKVMPDWEKRKQKLELSLV